MKIYAVVVTYNRRKLLEFCLEELKNQTHTLDKIIVVNNGSTDDTEEYLKQQTGISVIHQENLGGAGGFFTGVKSAYESGADWVWMMDDDVKAERDCLEKLLQYTSISECIHPNRFYSDKKQVNWEHYFSLKDHQTIDFPLEYFSSDQKEVSFINVGCFEGMLISRRIIRKIGFPDSRFFIAGDDTIYGVLANFHTNVSLIRNACMYRAKKSSELPYSPFYLYYNFRNFHLFNEYYIKIYKDNYAVAVHIRFLKSALKYIGSIIKEKRIEKSKKINYISAVLKGVYHSYQKKICNTY